MIFKNLKLKKTLKLIMFIAIFILGIVLIILPKSYFDTGQSTCISVLLFDIKCYGCGMTRALQHLIHFDFNSAYDFNKLSFIVLPLLIYMIIHEFILFLKE